MGQRSVKLILSRVVCFATSYRAVAVCVANHRLGRPSGGCRRRGDPGIHDLCNHRETLSPVGMCGWSPVRIVGQGGPAVKSRWANVVLQGPGQPAQCSNGQHADWLLSLWTAEPRARTPLTLNRTRPDQPAQGGNTQYADLARHDPSDCGGCVATRDLHSTGSEPRKMSR